MRKQSTRKRIEAARDSVNAWVTFLRSVVFLAGPLWAAYSLSPLLVILVLAASAVSLLAYGVLIRYRSFIRKFCKQIAPRFIDRAKRIL